ncbi:MAG: ketopantoate reductase family protein [Candidatus Omnitrophota bacterium]
MEHDPYTLARVFPSAFPRRGNARPREERPRPGPRGRNLCRCNLRLCYTDLLMRILIFGAGGIGSVLGGFLARMGHDVSLLGRAWHLDEIKKRGLTVTGIWGDYRVKAFDLYHSAQEILTKNLSFDLIFLTVKSYDTKQAVAELAPLMKENTTLISFQNGLGNIETILEKIPAENFLPGRAIFGVETEPGLARITVQADELILGALPGVTTKKNSAEIAHLLSLAKVQTKAVPDILTHIWSKVIYNCALNALCTLHEMPYGEILKKEDTRRAMEEIVRECYAVGQAKKAALEPPTAEGYLDLLIQTLIPRTASHYPSMLQDLQKGRRTEIEALNGAICRLGKELGVPTPRNEKITQAILKKFAI